MKAGWMAACEEFWHWIHLQNLVITIDQGSDSNYISYGFNSYDVISI